MLDLTEKTVRLIEKFFLDDEIQGTIKLLKTKCGNNLPFCKDYTSKQMERIQFAAVKVSDGQYEKLLEAVNLANIDWRDLLLLAGFAHDNNYHEEWANSVLKN